jgi:hypothetical protein
MTPPQPLLLLSGACIVPIFPDINASKQVFPGALLVCKPSINTYRAYEQIIRVNLKPGLGHIQLHELKPLHLQNYYVEKLVDLSAQTVKHHYRLLSKALNDAVDWEFWTKMSLRKPNRQNQKNLERLSILKRN